jgi:hypothetical protein
VSTRFQKTGSFPTDFVPTNSISKDRVLLYGFRSDCRTGLEIGQDPSLTRLASLIKRKHRTEGLDVTFGNLSSEKDERDERVHELGGDAT